MPRRRGDGPGHTRARRRAQEAAVRGLVADAVAEAKGAHAAARCDLEGSARAFLNETALPAVRALNGAGAPTLLPAMHRIVNAVRPGLISPEAALYGHWMEWRESNRSGRPLSMGDALRMTGAGSAMSLHSSAPALLRALRTRYPRDAAPYLNQARATYPGGVSELDAALHLLHPPDEDLEVGEVTVFVEGADEASARPRPTNPVYDGTGPTPPYAVVYEAFPREPTWCPALPPATHAPRGWANPDLSPPLSRTKGAHHRGQVLWQECPGTPLLLLVVATRGDPGRILGITPTHLYGATPVPRPPLPAPASRDGVHTFLRTQEVTAVTGVHLVRLPPAPLDDPRGPRALSPAPDWELWRDAWAAWLPRLPSQCRWMAADPRPCGTDATAGPPPPPPPPRRAPHGTAHGTALMQQEVVGRARLPPRMPTRVTAMADSDGSLGRDDRHHRRSRSRSPVSSPEWTGETLGEREERRLAEAAVVGPPPPAREPGPAETAAPAAQAASPAAPPRPDAQEAETAASHAAAPAAAPGTPQARGAAPAQEPDASPRAAAAAQESKQGARGVATDPARAVGASQAAAAAAEKTEEDVRESATAATGASSAAAAAAKESAEGARGAAAPGTPRKRGKNPARAADASPAAAAAAAVGRESAKYRAHANPAHTHTSPPKPYPPKPFPPGRERHVRPRTREPSTPGVTLPQLQRQRDARRVVQEGRSGEGEGSGGRRDRQGAGEGSGHGKGARERGQETQVQGTERGVVGERAGRGVVDERRDPRLGQGVGEGPGHGKGGQGRGKGTQAQGAGQGGMGERAGRGVGDERRDPRHGHGTGKGPKGKGKGKGKGPKGQEGRGTGAQGGGRGEGRGAEGGAPPQPEVQPVRCIPPGIQQMPAHHTYHHHHHHHHHLYNIDPDAGELIPPQPPRHQHQQAPPAPRAEPARMASAEGGRGVASAPQAQEQRGGPAQGAEESRPWNVDWSAVPDPLGGETLPLVGEVYGWLCWANQGTSRRSRNRPFDAVLLRRDGGNREAPPGGWAAPEDHERVLRSVIRAAWPDREPTWPAFLEGGAVLRITDADANNWLPRALRSALAHWRYRRHNPPPPQPQPPHKRRRK